MGTAERAMWKGPPVLLAAVVLMCWSSCCPPYLVLARQRPRSKLNLWIDNQQVQALIGDSMGRIAVHIIDQGVVQPLMFSDHLMSQIIIPSHVDTVNLTWEAGPERYTYLFDNFTSLDQHLLYQPLLGIPTRGYIPKYPTVFQITIPCKGKGEGYAWLRLGLKIYDAWGRPLEGTPLQFRLKKKCVKFAMCNPSCQNNGTCISPATCDCPEGFHGQFCEKALCGRTCLNGGHCLPEGFCFCAKGFYGDACEYSYCNPPCRNGGTCAGTGHCLCSAEFSGDRCEKPDNEERSRRSEKRETSTARPPKRRPRKPNVLEQKVRKAEQRLLKMTYRRSRKWKLPKNERRYIRRLKRKADKKALSHTDRRWLVRLLTEQRRHLNSKDKTKLKRFQKLIRKIKRRQKKPKKPKQYVR